MTKPDFMVLAFTEAEKALRREEVPVGAVLIDSRTNSLLASSGNRVEELKDPSAHAELLVIREAARIAQEPRLPYADLYVTLEPCALCAAAISFARIRRVYYAALDPKGGAIEHGPRFFSQPTCHHRPHFFGGLDDGRCAALLQHFFEQRRKKE